jgi:hypothetical protein
LIALTELLLAEASIFFFFTLKKSGEQDQIKAVESKGRSVLEGQPNKLNKQQTQGPLIFNTESSTAASASALFGICLCYTWHGDVGLSSWGGLQKWPGMDCN